MESPRILGATGGNTVAPRTVSPWKCKKILVVIDPSAEQHACLDKAMRLAQLVIKQPGFVSTLLTTD